MARTPDSNEWRCRCGALLGITDGYVIQIKYKQIGFDVRGEVKTHCRRCGTPSEKRSDASLAAGA